MQLSKNIQRDESHKGKIGINNEFDAKTLENAKAEGSASRSSCGDNKQAVKREDIQDTDMVDQISAKLYQHQQFPAQTTDKSSDQRSTYGRLRVVTAPPSAQSAKGKLTTTSTGLYSLQDQDNPDHLDSSRATKAVVCQQRVVQSNRRSATLTNLRPSSSGGTGGTAVSASTQRANSGGGGTAIGSLTAKSSGTGTGDHSVTQFALIDDENVSALQQVTKGGGALTLASQWKSQFDDSEDTTDNEWKQEPQVTNYIEYNTYTGACVFEVYQLMMINA